MALRSATRHRWGAAAVRVLDQLNQRHPWSHNDAFHSWILTRLPERRELAIDVGCGCGELVATLAERFERVHGIDRDEVMREAASRRCAGMGNVTIDDAGFMALGEGAGLVTMVAVLHHLDIDSALLWELASVATNPVIGMVRHPWPTTEPPERAPFPTAEPQLTLAEVTRAVDAVMPDAIVHRRLAFRHTIEWTKP